MPEGVGGDKYNMRLDITLNKLCVLFTYCNRTGNFDAGVVGWVFILADFGEAACILLLVILATYSGNAICWKKSDLQHDGDNTQFAWLLYWKANVWKCFEHRC